MYTLGELRDKTFKELKAIGWQLNALPDGDKRCRQNWVDAIVGVLPPLLKLLEAAPADSEHSPGAIDIQRQGSIVQVPKTPPIEEQSHAEPNGIGTGQTGADEIAIGTCIHRKCFDTAQPDGGNDGTQTETLGSQEGDRILAAAGNGQATERRPLPRESNELTAIFNDERPPNRGDNDRDRLESEPIILSQSAIELAAKNSRSVDRPKSKFSAHQLLALFESRVHILESPIEHSPGVEVEPVTEPEPIEFTNDLNPILTGVTFSPQFLALYSPPQSEKIHYKVDIEGQLSLLNFEIEVADEPPDPDDFDCMFQFWAAYDAWDARTDDEYCEFSPLCEPMEVTNEIIETVSSTLESSSTCELIIPVFVESDRTGDDEPPTAGAGVRRPSPKPPTFGPVMVAADDRTNHIQKFARLAIHSCGRAPPGGDATPCA